MISWIIKYNQFLGQLQQTKDILWGPSMIGVLSWAQNITRTGTRSRTQQGKQITKNANLSSKLETQRHKARTWYMLENDSNITLF